MDKFQVGSCKNCTSVMSGKPKSKKSSQAAVYDPDTPDSLVSALAGEILAPENINLLLPVAMFAVRAFFCSG